MIPIALASILSLSGIATASDTLWPPQDQVVAAKVGQEDAVLIVAISDYLYLTDRLDIAEVTDDWVTWFSTR